MALIKCIECGKEISKKAESCPNCGAPRKKEQTQYGCGTVVVLAVLGFVFFGALSDNDSSTSSSEPKTKEELRAATIERHFSAWDGSHRGLTALIKKSMNDPDSYEHVETVYWDRSDHLVVRTTFRGRNAFGGMVRNSVTAKVDLNGTVIEVISQEP